MAVAMAPPAALSMRRAVLIAGLVSVGFGPQASLAQGPHVTSDDTPTTAQSSSASAVEQWEEAIAQRLTDADAWSRIGQRLHAAGHYRECIAALERSLVLRVRHAREDDNLIADAYVKLGNVKQAARWSRQARPASARLEAPPRGNRSADL